jgi:hypothetical protein
MTPPKLTFSPPLSLLVLVRFASRSDYTSLELWLVFCSIVAATIATRLSGARARENHRAGIKRADRTALFGETAISSGYGLARPWVSRRAVWNCVGAEGSPRG